VSQAIPTSRTNFIKTQLIFKCCNSPTR